MRVDLYVRNAWVVAACALVLLGAGLLGLLLAFGRAFPATARVPLGPHDQMVTVDGVRIRFRVFGSGRPTVLMLHGFASQLESWQPLAEAWSCGTPVAMDLPGFGGSDRPPMSYDLATQSHFVIGFLDALGLDRVVLVGQSMGSSVAVWTAAHYSDRVSKLVLFAPSGLPGSLHYRGLRGALVRPGFLNRVAQFLVDMPFASVVLRNSLARQGLSVASSYDDRFTAALRRVRQPALLVWSKGDQRVPIRYAQEYLGLMPDASLLALGPEAGHGGFRFAPDSTADEVCHFVRRSAP